MDTGADGATMPRSSGRPMRSDMADPAAVVAQYVSMKDLWPSS